MRTITADQRQAIEDLSAEGLLKGLPVQTAEKDIHVTELLKALSQLKVKHSHFSGLDSRRGDFDHEDSGIQLVFGGGTCLSKAHRLINRMSEDIDIKVILNTPEDKALKRGVGSRARLIALHDHLVELLRSLDFFVSSSPVVRDSHRYYEIEAEYATSYDQLPALRANVKLELINRHPLLPVENLQFGYLYESFSSIPETYQVSFPCVSVAETLAEKVLSFLRRYAVYLKGNSSSQFDETLIRHFYDVACILDSSEAYLDKAKAIFRKLVEAERVEYKSTDQSFYDDPFSVLRNSLEKAGKDDDLARMYREKLVSLIFNQELPSYEVSFQGFEMAAREILSLR